MPLSPCFYIFVLIPCPLHHFLSLHFLLLLSALVSFWLCLLPSTQVICLPPASPPPHQRAPVHSRPRRCLLSHVHLIWGPYGQKAVPPKWNGTLFPVGHSYWHPHEKMFQTLFQSNWHIHTKLLLNETRDEEQERDSDVEVLGSSILTLTRGSRCYTTRQEAASEQTK